MSISEQGFRNDGMHLFRIIHLHLFRCLIVLVCSFQALLGQAPQLVLKSDAIVNQPLLWINTNKPQSVGRAFYQQPIPICETDAWFNTTFVFSIRNYTTTRGEGLAFTISGELKPPPADSYGQWLGLLNKNMNKNPDSHIVAVEFDTVKNLPEELNDNHVGVDENQIESQASPTLGTDQTGRANLHDPSQNISVWIEYLNGSLTVFVNGNNVHKPQIAVVPPYTVNLCQSAAVQGNVYVGFSASTGNSSTAKDVHMIHSWNFTSKSRNFSFTSFENDNATLPPPGGSPRTTPRRRKTSVITISLVTVFSVLFILLSCYYATFMFRRRLGRYFSSEAELSLRGDLEHNMPCMPSEFTHTELKAATGNFSQNNILGEGGFGKVYVGTLSSDQSLIAVKRISEDSQQGVREFLAEVQIISKLSHRNLVQLRGWCSRTKELLLVYEYMPNGSLDKALYSNTTLLEWAKRYEIVCGLASALLYLHEECEQRVVHRDIKPSNIMLDVDFNAKLGDFGLARLVERNRDARTTTVAGTFGYLAPELNVTLKSTPASDVYSLGIVVLEVACGRKPFQATSDKMLVQWVWELYCQGKLLEAADVRLEGRFEKAEMETLLTVGLSCSDPSPKGRPSMLQVVNMLKGNSTVPIGLLSRKKTEDSWYTYEERSSFSLSDTSGPVSMVSNSMHIPLKFNINQSI